MRQLTSDKLATFSLLWSTVSAAGMLMFETVDVNTSLAATLPAVWFWTFLAVQGASLQSIRRQKEQTTELGTRVVEEVEPGAVQSRCGR